MNEYRPDVWVIILLASFEHGKHCRVLAGWYGGYLGEDSYRVSSGITKIIDKDDHWEIHNDSGSIYYCGKQSERLSGITANVLNGYMEQNSETASVQRTTIENALLFLR